MVAPFSGSNVESYAGYLTVNKTYNSNLFFWFFPAQVSLPQCPNGTLTLKSRLRCSRVEILAYNQPKAVFIFNRLDVFFFFFSKNKCQ